jgi:hypothetical protein
MGKVLLLFMVLVNITNEGLKQKVKIVIENKPFLHLAELLHH